MELPNFDSDLQTLRDLAADAASRPNTRWSATRILELAGRLSDREARLQDLITELENRLDTVTKLTAGSRMLIAVFDSF